MDPDIQSWAAVLNLHRYLSVTLYLKVPVTDI